jgi:glycosyltransferase involved in cell wall biosynthesis
VSGRSGLRVGLNLIFMTAAAGGAGRYARELIPAMLTLESELRMTAFTSSDLPQTILEEPWAGEIEWIHYPHAAASRRALVAQMVELPRAAAQRKLDVVHSPANIGLLGTFGVANVVTLLDLIWLHRETSPLGPRQRLRAKLLFVRCARAADRVLTISEATKRDLVATLGLEPERIDVTPLGVADRESRATPEAELRTRLRLGSAPFVLCVAQKQPHKNLESLIRAIAHVPDAGVVLAGAREAHEDRLRELAGRDGVAERVHFVDWVDDADLEGLYRAARCFVLPSLVEGFGLPLLEAMRHGLPVACSDRSSLPEVVGDAALLFDPTDQEAVTAAVLRLVRDEALRRDLAERGRERARTFSWSRTAARTLASYRLAIAARSARRRFPGVRLR